MTIEQNLSDKLWCDLRTDEERSAWLLLGRGHETGVVAVAIQNDLAMAYHRLAALAQMTAAAPESQAERVTELEALLREARGVIQTCGGEWRHGGFHLDGDAKTCIARIDAALGKP